MKRRLIVGALGLLALVLACSRINTTPIPGVVQLYAAALPYNATFTWNPNAASENVVSYVVSLDGNTTSTVQPTACTGTPVVCSTTLVLATTGPHTASVAAQNITLSGDPGVIGTLQTGPASTLNLNVNAQPSKTTGAGVK